MKDALGHGSNGTHSDGINSLPIEAARSALRNEVDRTSAALQAFPRGATGLTPDDVKSSPEFRSAKAAYDRAFSALRSFNTRYKPPRRGSR